MVYPMVFSPAAKSWHPTHLLLLLTAWLGTVGNLPLWIAIWRLPETQGLRGAATFLGFLVVVLGLLAMFLSLVVWPRWLKFMGLLFLIMSTASSYFMLTYGVVIDTSMLVNAAQTDVREVRDLLSWSMLASVLLGVVLPGYWWWRQPVRRVRATSLIGRQLAVAVAALLVATLVFWLAFQDMASLMRNHKPLRYMINPLNGLYASVHLVMGQAAQATRPLLPLGEDAQLRKPPVTEQAAPLIILVLGETARAANFGLSGYARDTTPQLRQLQAQGQLVYFQDVTSCGTSTQASVPCMFSHLGKDKHDRNKERYESLLDVLHRAGLAVLWIDNQSGCKGVCDRVPYVSTQALQVPGLCKEDECFDEVMLKALPQQLAALDPVRRARGTVVVMHQMGSHGPAYHKRSPQAFKKFTPECTSSALQTCPAEHIVNTYDNSILYTDHFLASTVAWLKSQPRPTAMMYVSDHGESLGEKGLYLHGMPYSMAPKEQTHVPMVLWLSLAMQKQQGGSMACLQGQSAKALSHDHLFHSVLGLAQVSTRVAKPELDLFAACAATR